MTDLFMEIFWLLVVVMLIPLWVRMVWFGVARVRGTWNPETFHKWIWLPWRKLAELWVRFSEWRGDEFTSNENSTAKWGGLLGRLILVYKPGDVLLGGFGYYGFRLFQPLGFKAQRHLAMVAGTGTGKTTLLISMLGLHRGNAFVIDPKGQIAKIIARRRGAGGNGIEGMGHDVHILDPNNIVAGFNGACWNAIDELARVEAREGKDAVVRYAMTMAEGLVPLDGDKPYFPQTAREFLQGLILYVYTCEPPEHRNMVRVRTLLTRGLAAEMFAEGASAEVVNDQGFKMLLSEMQLCNAYDGAIANAAATMANTGKSYGDVLSTARTALKFYDLPEIRTISQSSDFSLEDLKLGNVDLFVCAPTGDIRGKYKGWFRLMTVLSLDLFEQIQGNLSEPTLFAIDEMPSLGHIEAIAISAPVMRSYGVRLLAITQDLGLLEKAYPKEWGSFLGNADVTYWMGTDHQSTLKYLSDHLGEATHVRREYGRWRFWNRGGKHPFTTTLMTPDQLGMILSPRKENMVLTRFGKRPIRVKTMPYYKELPVNFYDADSEHQETPSRQRRRAAYTSIKIMPENLQSPLSNQVETPASHIARESPFKPKRNRKIPEIEISQAFAIFGISGPYTMDDLNKRRTLLASKANESAEFAAVVESAYEKLAKPYKGQGHYRQDSQAL